MLFATRTRARVNEIINDPAPRYNHMSHHRQLASRLTEAGRAASSQAHQLPVCEDSIPRIKRTITTVCTLHVYMSGSLVVIHAGRHGTFLYILNCPENNGGLFTAHITRLNSQQIYLGRYLPVANQLSRSTFYAEYLSQLVENKLVELMVIVQRNGVYQSAIANYLSTGT